MNIWRDFHGPNAGYVLELYERYRQDPESVDGATRAFFDGWTPPADEPGQRRISSDQLNRVAGAANLAQAIRENGHLAAQIDPLGSSPPADPSLTPAAHNLTEEQLRQLPASIIGGPVASQSDNGWEAIKALYRVYASTTGYDYDHLQNPEERDWLRHAAESGRFRPPQEPINPKWLLKRLTRVEVFEQFLHRTFPGKTRFSIEGLDMLVPILDELIGAAAEATIYTVLIGMAHRGRLNVLAHNLNKPYTQILAEFKDPLQGHRYVIRDDLGWTGDVKYHRGARRSLKGGQPVDMTVRVSPNPSHLETINPVVEGMARAAGTCVHGGRRPRFAHIVSLPVLIHGDASFSGQGIVAETLNLARLPGYRTGGTIHIIANNQLGFTATPEVGRSTRYASDPAKGFKIPIVHVNADDPEACIAAARLAFAYRNKFEKDFLIDLVGYRRHGHNEGDEPSFTQPRLYQGIQDHPTVRAQWATTLERRGLIEADWPEALVEEYMAELQEVLAALEPAADLAEQAPDAPPPQAAGQVETAVPLEQLRKLNNGLLQFPEGFHLHKKLKKSVKKRRQILEDAQEPTVEWAAAEQLALASILADGVAIRFTGQDVERGTFSQRHAVFHDVENGEAYIPLQHLPQVEVAFEIRNSPLSENAALGFEFGYNIQEPGRLVIWEAQYGDFINNAQVIVDEFITSARSKWGLTPSMVLLLPHAHEGQGPDHSTGRPERFLQMAAETNIRIANCTTSAQYFHLLRRQAALLETDPLPLVVMTPKSLLRKPFVASPPEALAAGGWQPVIDDPQPENSSVRRVIVCSGKAAVDLLTAELREKTPEVAIIRLEQLYPLPATRLKSVIEQYSDAEEIVWLQEEPKNMGVWSYLRPQLVQMVRDRKPLYYLGRHQSSSPAEGSWSWHSATQQKLVERAFNLDNEETEEDGIRWDRA